MARVSTCCSSFSSIWLWLRERKMKHGFYAAILIATMSLPSFAQSETTTLRSITLSAVVWDENLPTPASSEIIDPVTGASVRSLTHDGIEVHSQAAFRLFRSGRAGELLTFLVTVVNNTDSDAVLTQAGLVIDGSLSLELLPETSGTRSDDRPKVEGSLCMEPNVLSGDTPLRPLTRMKPSNIAPRMASTFRFVAKDPRNYSLLCSPEGCYPKGVMRFYATLNSTDYVFVWKGQALVNCGR